MSETGYFDLKVARQKDVLDAISSRPWGSYLANELAVKWNVSISTIYSDRKEVLADIRGSLTEQTKEDLRAVFLVKLANAQALARVGRIRRRVLVTSGESEIIEETIEPDTRALAKMLDIEARAIGAYSPVEVVVKATRAETPEEISDRIAGALSRIPATVIESIPALRLLK